VEETREQRREKSERRGNEWGASERPPTITTTTEQDV
jgi:hypothetical protein